MDERSEPVDGGPPPVTYQVNCQHEDRFMVETEDEDEAVEHIKQHAREKHDMDLGDDDARGMIQQA